MTLCLSQIARNHFSTHFLSSDFRNPTELCFSFARIAQQGFNLGWAEVTWIYAYQNIACFYRRGLSAFNGDNCSNFVYAMTLELKRYPQFCRCPDDKLPHRILDTGGNNEVFRLILLQHQPLHLNVILCMPPVTQGINVAHV